MRVIALVFNCALSNVSDTTRLLDTIFMS